MREIVSKEVKKGPEVPGIFFDKYVQLKVHERVLQKDILIEVQNFLGRFKEEETSTLKPFCLCLCVWQMMARHVAESSSVAVRSWRSS